MIEYKESTRSFFIFYVIQVNYTEVTTQLKYYVNFLDVRLITYRSQSNKEIDIKKLNLANEINSSIEKRQIMGKKARFTTLKI